MQPRRALATALLSLAALPRWQAVSLHAPDDEATGIAVRPAFGAGRPAVIEHGTHGRSREAEDSVLEPPDGAQVVHFGPMGCIATWRSSDSHCVIRTDCLGDTEGVDDYSVKLLCVGPHGEKVRHVFTQGAFSNQESFDTLIHCDECLAGEELHYEPPPKPKGRYGLGPTLSPKDTREANASLQLLIHEVRNLEADLQKASLEVEKLNAKVFGVSTLPQGSSQPAAGAPVDAHGDDAAPAGGGFQGGAHGSPHALLLRRRHGAAAPPPPAAAAAEEDAVDTQEASDDDAASDVEPADLQTHEQPADPAQ